jgi:gas vesicle protein
MDRRINNLEVGVAFLLGAALGAGVALLLAPASGRETRQKLAEYGEKTYTAGKGKVAGAISAAKSRLHRETSIEA